MSAHLPEQASADLIGLAALMRVAYAGEPLQPVFDALVARVNADPRDAAALMDLSTVLMLSNQREAALEVQAQALAIARIYRRPHGRGDGLRVMAFVAPGDFMANTPLDFMLEGSDVDLWLVHLGAQGRPPAEMPDHEVAVMAVGEAPEATALLAGMDALLPRWPRPVINGRPGAVAALTRDGVAALFADGRHVVAPPAWRLTRAALAETPPPFPVIARPIGSHAGKGLEKLEDAQGLAAYLAAQPEETFYVSPFVDYASADGLYRKQRIAFVDGRPFIAHMAVSEHWMVHYLSAGMTESAAKRDEEAAFMAGFDTGFARRHADAFRALHERLGLDYFAIDCAETADGRLLLFEADVAMIVHALDPDPPFGYKRPVMRRLFAAFQEALASRRATQAAAS